MIGAAIWQAQEKEQLAQVGGNVGRGHSYSLTVTKGNEKQPSVVDAFLSSKWTFFQRTEVAEVYILCYPLGKKYVLSVHFSGSDGLSADDLKAVVENNQDLFRTINHLVGEDSA